MPQFHYDPESPPASLASELIHRGFDLDEPVHEFHGGGWVVLLQVREGETPKFEYEPPRHPGVPAAWSGPTLTTNTGPTGWAYQGRRMFCFPKTLCGNRISA